MTQHIRLISDVEIFLFDISEKFGVSRDFSYTLRYDRHGNIIGMSLEIVAAEEISCLIPKRIVGWAPSQIQRWIMPILEDLAST